MAALLTFQQLLNAVQSQQSNITDVIGSLTGSGIAGITDWATPGTWQYCFIQSEAYFEGQTQQYVATLANNLTAPQATQGFLTNLAQGFFGISRPNATPTMITALVTTSLGNGPYSMAPGELQFTFDSYTFANSLFVTLNSSLSPQTIAMAAVVPQAASNGVEPGEPGTLVAPGLTGLAAQVGAVTVLGTDMQSDQSLQQQCTTQWATLAKVGVCSQNIINAVVTANPALSDVYVNDQNPNGPGTVDVYVSTPDNVGTAAQIAAISGTIQVLFPNGAGLVTGPEGTLPRINITAPAAVVLGTGGINTAFQIYYNPSVAPGGDLTALSGSIVAALDTWIGTVPTGGLTYGPGFVNVANIAGAIDAVENIPGVVACNIFNQSNIQLGNNPVQKLTSPNYWTDVFIQLSASLYVPTP